MNMKAVLLHSAGLLKNNPLSDGGMLSKTLAPSYSPVLELSHSGVAHDVTVTPVFRKRPLLERGNSGKQGE